MLAVLHGSCENQYVIPHLCPSCRTMDSRFLYQFYLWAAINNNMTGCQLLPIQVRTVHPCTPDMSNLDDTLFNY